MLKAILEIIGGLIQFFTNKQLFDAGVNKIKLETMEADNEIKEKIKQNNAQIDSLTDAELNKRLRESEL